MDVVIENGAAFHDDYELFRVRPAQLDDTSAVPLVKLIDLLIFRFLTSLAFIVDMMRPLAVKM